MARRAWVALLAVVAVAGCGSGGGETPATAAGATCDSAAFLPVLQASLDNDATKLHIAEANVRRCQKGYAEVAAVPDNAACKPGVEYCYDTATVFLEAIGDEWTILDVGTGVSCQDSDLSDKLRTACESLAHPG